MIAFLLHQFVKCKPVFGQFFCSKMNGQRWLWSGQLAVSLPALRTIGKQEIGCAGVGVQNFTCLVNEGNAVISEMNFS
jgi:hypothetical protein